MTNPKFDYENEITGSYHNDKADWLAVSIVVLMLLAGVLIIGEQSGITSLIFGTV